MSDVNNGAQEQTQAAPPATFEGLTSPEDVSLIQAKGWAKDGKVDLPAVLGSYRNAEKAIGADKIILPGKDAKPEEWGKVFDKLGRPEKADGYALTKPENATWYSDEFAGQFKTLAHEAGLTAAQAAKVHDFYAAEVGKTMGEKMTQATTQIDALKKELGPNFAAVEAAAKAAATQAMQASGVTGADFDALGNAIGHDKVIKMFAHLGKGMVEDKAVEGTRPALGGAEAAKDELKALESSDRYQKAIGDPMHPDHAAVMKERRALYDKAYGTRPAGGVTTVQM